MIHIALGMLLCFAILITGCGLVNNETSVEEEFTEVIEAFIGSQAQKDVDKADELVSFADEHDKQRFLDFLRDEAPFTTTLDLQIDVTKLSDTVYEAKVVETKLAQGYDEDEAFDHLGYYLYVFVENEWRLYPAYFYVPDGYLDDVDYYVDENILNPNDIIIFPIE